MFTPVKFVAQLTEDIEARDTDNALDVTDRGDVTHINAPHGKRVVVGADGDGVTWTVYDDAGDGYYATDGLPSDSLTEADLKWTVGYLADFLGL